MKKYNLNKPFILTRDLYKYYLSALLICSHLDFKDNAKAKVFGKNLNQIYRNISLNRLYASLGANSTNRRAAVRAAMSVYYVRTTRGSQLNAANSGWQNLGNKKQITSATYRILKTYRLLNEETLMELELKLYEKNAFEKNDDGTYKLDAAGNKQIIQVPEISMDMRLTKDEIRDLLKLAAEIDAEDAALLAKKPRKPRPPDTPETKEKKRLAAVARREREAQIVSYC